MAGQSRASSPLLGKGVGEVFVAVDDAEEEVELDELLAEDVGLGVPVVDIPMAVPPTELRFKVSRLLDCERGFLPSRAAGKLGIAVVFLLIEAATPLLIAAPTITIPNPTQRTMKMPF